MHEAAQNQVLFQPKTETLICQYSNVRWHIYKLQEVSKQLKALYYRQFILTIACSLFPVPCAQRYNFRLNQQALSREKTQ